jgi:sugar O-acyltransferase (sialic acid O-acetyltransferase NeuD family)
LKSPIVLIGYSGHAYVIVSILESTGQEVTAYCDQNEKEQNPFKLIYLGKESEAKALEYLDKNNYIICIGDNKIRQKVFNNLTTNEKIKLPLNAVHKNTIIDRTAQIENGGVMISANVIINPLVQIKKGVICNTGCVIEHECIIGEFAHIGPGAVLCGNVKIGFNTFIGANSVVKQNVTIGNNVTVGAGSVVLRDLPDGVTVYGNPARIIR